MKLSEVSGGVAAPTKLSQVGAGGTTDTLPDPYTAAAGTGVTAENVGELGKGFVEGAIGVPLAIGRSLFKFGKQTPQDYSTSVGFAPPKDSGAANLRAVGDIAGFLAMPLPGAKVAEKVGESAVRLIPGAAKRAAALVERIGQPRNPNDIGEAVRQAIAPRLKQFETTRQIEFQKWLQSQGKTDIAQARIDDPAFDRAFRTKYRELSEDVNQFENQLGKQATAEGRAALNLPSVAFKSRDSVRAFKRLAGNDEAVNQIAREWVSRQLHDATQPAIVEQTARPWELRSIKAANAARKWFDKADRDWLHELPEIRDEAKRFVENFERVSKTQKHAALAVTGGALLGATEAFGMHPLSRALRLGGL